MSTQGITAVVVGAIVVAAAIAGALLLRSGDDAVPTPTPRVAATATPTRPPGTGQRLSEVNNGGAIELNPGDRFFITLEGNPSTGYTWEIDSNVGGRVAQVGPIESRPVSDMPGAPNVQVIRFEAMYGGEGDLKLKYHRPWETGVAPVKTFVVHVTVN
ncbi:MAG: protease inhibitor I42 family protein [SAR202 cluster bacterium]|nr:protease inhibitor I42 family protein [SAR202 cluster bacterium]